LWGPPPSPPALGSTDRAWLVPGSKSAAEAESPSPRNPTRSRVHGPSWSQGSRRDRVNPPRPGFSARARAVLDRPSQGKLERPDLLKIGTKRLSPLELRQVR